MHRPRYGNGDERRGQITSPSVILLVSTMNSSVRNETSRAFPDNNTVYMVIPNVIQILSATQDEIEGELFDYFIVRFVDISLRENKM